MIVLLKRVVMILAKHIKNRSYYWIPFYYLRQNIYDKILS